MVKIPRAPMDLLALVRSFDYPRPLLVPHGKRFSSVHIQRVEEKKWAVMHGSFVLTGDGKWLIYEAANFRPEEAYVESFGEAFARADRFAEHVAEVEG